MSSILQPVKTVAFDPTNPEHRKVYVDFLNTGKWSVRFDLEYPFTNLPSLVMFKLATEACKDVGEVDQQALLSKSFVIGRNNRFGGAASATA